MWDQPYLETCCRAALHRLHLSGAAGRPSGVADDPCLVRLTAMGLCLKRPDGRFAITPDGAARHAGEILRQSAGTAMKRPEATARWSRSRLRLNTRMGEDARENKRLKPLP